MAIFVLSGANGAPKGAWPDELDELRPEHRISGGVVNMSMAGAGPLSALAQLALARNLSERDVIIWDHADAIASCVKDAGYDLADALRLVEMFLRGCARRKVAVAPMISERLVEANSILPDETTARLHHLFERFCLTPLSLTAELRGGMNRPRLNEKQFTANAASYTPGRPTSRVLGKAIAEHARFVETLKRAPVEPSAPIFAASKGVLRVALPGNADRAWEASAMRARIGPIETEILHIEPGGAAEFTVEGEVLGLAAVIGPNEGSVALDLGPKTPDELRRAPISLWSPREEPAFGQVLLSHLIERRLFLNEATPLVIHNVSTQKNLAGVRADHAAAPPPGYNPEAPVRILAVIERRPGYKPG